MTSKLVWKGILSFYLGIWFPFYPPDIGLRVFTILMSQGDLSLGNRMATVNLMSKEKAEDTLSGENIFPKTFIARQEVK